LLAGVVLVATAGPCGVGAQSPTLAISGATLIDGNGGQPVPDAVVLVSDGRIVSAGPRAGVEIPAAATVIDAKGKFVLPGLIDTNVHLSLYGGWRIATKRSRAITRVSARSCSRPLSCN
jgi:imidazolonepropionase-like amidohydrolase